MRENHALAAGQGGNKVAAPRLDDEAQRQSTVQELAHHLARGSALLERCESLASTKRGDRLGPILAAARLLYANAQVAKVLAQVALVETRRRTIIEAHQRSKPTEAELNAQWVAEAEARDDARAKLERRLDQLLEAARRNAPAEPAADEPPNA